MITILRGIPGSGKSFYTKSIMTNDTIICSADSFFMKSGEYVFDIQQIGQAHKACLKQYHDSILQGKENIIVDNTNIEAWEVSPYVALANLFDREYIIANIICDQQIAFNRQQHGVPEKNHKRMFERHAKAIFPKWNVKHIK